MQISQWLDPELLLLISDVNFILLAQIAFLDLNRVLVLLRNITLFDSGERNSPDIVHTLEVLVAVFSAFNRVFGKSSGS